MIDEITDEGDDNRRRVSLWVCFTDLGRERCGFYVKVTLIDSIKLTCLFKITGLER